MLKKIGLKISTKKSLQDSKRRTLVSLQDAKSVAILVEDLNSTRESLSYFKDQCEKESLKLTVIAFNNTKEKVSGHLIDYEVGSQDFDWIGRESTEKIKKIIKTPYDYLFCLNTSTNLPFESILSKSNANCRVGIVSEHTKEELFDLVINTKEKKDWLSVSKEMLRYIKMLKSES